MKEKAMKEKKVKGTTDPPPSARGSDPNPDPPPRGRGRPAGLQRGGNDPRPDPPPLRMATARPLRKLRVGGAVGIAAALALPLANAALQRTGLPAVTADDLRSAWDLGLAVYGSAAAAAGWVATYLARPSRADVPILDVEAAG